MPSGVGSRARDNDRYGPRAGEPVDERQLVRGDAPGPVPPDRSVQTARISDEDGPPVNPAVGGVGGSAWDPMCMIAAGSLGIGNRRWIFLVCCARLPWRYVLLQITLDIFFAAFSVAFF